jgi:hypothetical protein
MNKFDDWINPIAVKEMRQAVKGRFIAWMLIAYLLIQLLIIGAVLMLSEDLGEDFNIGRSVFMGHLGVLMGTCLFFLTSYTALRFSSERSENNIDLLFITTLSPIQIIWGKTFAAMVLTVLFFTASMPFMTLTYLLRGLDIPSVFVLLTFDFLVVGGCIQLGIILASLPGKIIAQGFRFLVGLALLVAIFSMTLQSSFGVLFFGIGSIIGTWDFWGPAITIGVCVLLGAGLLFVLSVTIITPASANKALYVRIYLLFIWIVTAIIACTWSLVTRVEEPIFFWMIAMIMMAGAKLFVSICERQRLGMRVTRTIPTNRLLRLPAFLLYSGAGGGVSFSILMIIGTIVLTDLFREAAYSFRGIRYDTNDKLFLMTAIALSLYALCYTLTALAVKRAFFAHSHRGNIPAIIALLLLVAGSVIPMMIGFLVRSNPWHEISPKWFLGNPFVVFWDEDILPVCLTFTGIWAIFAFALTIPWLLKQFRDFKTPVFAQNGISEAANE